MYAWAYLGDKYHIRAPFIFINGIMSLIGLPLLGFAHSNGVRYFGVFLATIACNANVPAFSPTKLTTSVVSGNAALCSATLVGAGGIGGIIGSTVFRDQDSPGYKPGIYATMIASALILIITALLTFKFHRANKRVEAGGKIIEGLHGFRYTL